MVSVNRELPVNYDIVSFNIWLRVVRKLFSGCWQMTLVTLFSI